MTSRKGQEMPVWGNADSSDDDVPSEYQNYGDDDDSSTTDNSSSRGSLSSTNDNPIRKNICKGAVAVAIEETEVRGRAWVFVVNNYTREDCDKVKLLLDEGSNVVYAIAGLEVGENGTPHIQGYVCFKNARFRSAIAKKFFPRAYLAKAKGSDEQNKTYCSKEENKLIEIGEARPGQGKRTDLIKAKDVLTETGSMLAVFEKHFETACKYQNGFTKYMSLLPQAKRSVEVVVRMQYAPEYVIEEAIEEYGELDVYVCWNPQWFDGYDGHKCIVVIYDVSKHSYLHTSRMLSCGRKTLLPVKNGFVPARHVCLFEADASAVGCPPARVLEAPREESVS